MHICVFSVWQLTKVKIDFESRFKMRMSIFIFLIFFGAFQSVFKKVKIGFPIVFSKSDVALAGVNCGDRLWVFFLEFLVHILSIGTFKILIFGLWSFSPHPYLGLGADSVKNSYYYVLTPRSSCWCAVSGLPTLIRGVTTHNYWLLTPVSAHQPLCYNQTLQPPVYCDNTTSSVLW